VTAIITQQITFRTIYTLIHKLFAVIVACGPSTVNCLFWSPCPQGPQAKNL
jgi:hypothetical protein